jgi:beta-glucosidase
MQMRFLVLLFISLSMLAARGPLQSLVLTFCNASLLRMKDLLNRFYLDEKVSLLIASLPDIPRLNIDKYYHGSEALHGIVWAGTCTIFLQAVALAITCNPEPHNELATALLYKAQACWNELEQGKKQLLGFKGSYIIMMGACLQDICLTETFVL